MAKYTIEGRFDGAEVTFETQVTKEFGDLELFGTLVQWKEVKHKTYWERVGVGGSITANAIVYQDTVYFGSCDKNFYAVSLEGKEIWRFETKGTIQTWAGAAGGFVYFSSSDGNLYAVDARTGEEKWRFQATGLGNTPLVHKGRIYWAAGDCGLYAIGAEKGEQVWRFKAKALLSLPLIQGEKIYTGYEDGVMYALNMRGEVLWQFAAKAWIAAWPPAYYQGTVFFGSQDKNLYALDSESGELKWKFQAPDVVHSPVVLDGKVYVGCQDQNLYCLDAVRGRLLWRYRSGGAISNVRAHGNRVYFGCYDNNLYCLDALSGRLVWKFKTNGFVHGAPAVHGNFVIFGSWDCNLYCLTLDGKLAWKFPTSLSTPSRIEPPEAAPSKVATITWTPVTKEEEKKYKKDEVDIADYGEFSGQYIDTTKSDYLGKKKKGYM
ncbi:MAG: PQQ-binding-like beta-propeller repeat protein [Candidatus Aenigmatarchaeota archaeon]